MNKILVAAAVVALSSTSVFAADLAARPYTKAPPAPVAPIYNWTGLYIGAQVGGAFQGSSGFVTDDPLVTGNRDDSSFLGGGVLGANYQFSPNWVLGIEGEFNGLSNNRYTFTDGFDGIRVKNDWLASVTGRLGYTWGPGMIYAKGGVAFRDNGGIAATTPFLVSRDTTGYTVGAGLEYMFAPAWSAKIEYQYYDFDRTALTFGTLPSTVSYRDDLHTVKAGINYHFNWGGPVVARY
ncbi:putative outer membrane protein [Afipia carboxidovorans OM5]|uniref:Putative outer membrane protein n=1 Tax=Afipia carboxidovorans (strain ATCC 49405 / DSM 1227 / KCTC 32145 / OM5) TaxID=504832 RepID=F8BT11_AFIC5|nr:outer membrane protein [Afipia carboxidovorans]AEI02932.1 putative outer membrane protein [Afipia carboxidovorans OM4]AEI06508.1 putative outer membrane protein [Afipia carboxidovorans OM5]